jgi:uncharacterized protein
MAIEQSGEHAGQDAVRQVTIRATNFDGSDHWVHPAMLEHADDSIVITATQAGLSIAREAGVFVSPFNTRAHYWPDRWFNVIRLELPGSTEAPARLDGFYCNIATPLEFDGATVSYVDLQLDVRVFVDQSGEWTYRVLDDDEFETARQRYGYSEELVQRARLAVEEVIALIEARHFPFD